MDHKKERVVVYDGPEETYGPLRLRDGHGDTPGPLLKHLLEVGVF